MFSKNTNNLYMVILLIGIAFLATGGIFVKLSEVEPVATAVYRIAMAMPIAFLWCVFDSKNGNNAFSLPLKDFLLLQLAGIFLAIDLILWHYSFHLTTVANGNLLANLLPFTVIPLSAILFKDRVTLKFMGALLVTVFGLVALLYGKLEITQDNLKGDLFALATSVFYALYFLTISYLRRTGNYQTSSIMFYSGFGSLLVLVPYAFVFETTYLPQTLNGFFVLLSIAIFSHILGQGLLATSLKHISPTVGSVLVLLQPVIAALYSYFIFFEQLTAMEIMGIIIVLVGIYLAKTSHG